VLTQTIPFPGEPGAGGELFSGAAGAIGDGAGAAADESGEFDDAGVGGDGAPVADELPIVTSGMILPIVAAETPAFDKSLTELYGRPEMILFAVASPTPGNSFSSVALALSRSTFAPAALEAFGFAEAADLLAAVVGVAVASPSVTNGAIFLIVAAETPAFVKSLTEAYGRPEIIFLAVATPTPGKLSNSCSVALFKSIFVFALLDCLVDLELAGACIPSKIVKIVKNMPTTLYVLLTVPPERPRWLFATLSAGHFSRRCDLVGD